MAKKTSAQLDREIAEALAKPVSVPVKVGDSPAGVEWVAYRQEDVAPMTARLAALRAKSAPSQLEAARKRYEALRARAFRFQGQRRKEWMAGKSTSSTDDAYWALSEELAEARRALRKAERAAKK